MNRINPEKLKDELASAIALIDLDMSNDGTVSNIIDRATRSSYSLLMTIIDGATEQVICDEVKELKEEVLRLRVEVSSLKKKVRVE